MDLFFSHFPISSRLDPSRRRKSVLHVRVTGLPILLWSRSLKHFLPQSCSFLKLPLWDSSVPACSQRWLWQHHTRSVQCFAAAALASCSLAQPACFRKALRTLFVHTERTVVFPFRTSNVIRSVRSSHLLSSSEISHPSSAKVSARSLIGSPRCDFTYIRKVALPARTRCVSRQIISRRISASGAVANVAFPPCPTHFLIAHKTRAFLLSADSRTFARSFLPEFAAPGPHLSIFARPIHTQFHSLKFISSKQADLSAHPVGPL
jgi:hypothetical protein